MSDSIKAFIVDDSAVVRQVLSRILDSDPEIEVIGSAPDPLFAEGKMQRQWPDVIVLDVEMPRMDGISFLKKIMASRPTPVVICSTLTEKGTAISIDALASGAVEVIAKPKVGLKSFLSESSVTLIRAVKAAARARVRQSKAVEPAEPSGSGLLANSKTTDGVVALGTSTGGTQALQAVLTRLPAICPGIVVVQHMPEKFTAAFADRLNRLCKCEIKEAEDGDRVLPGKVLIAPGGRHMQLERCGAQYRVRIVDGPPVNRHKPSVDVLFRSVARAAGSNAMGVIMTGMGNDGAQGLLQMRTAGALTAAQDEESCVVYGMPKEAVKLGAASQTVPLAAVPDLILQWES
jgi:two-component system chemotaxis response regulator CheB